MAETVTVEVPVRVTVPATDRALPRVFQVLSERLGYDEQYEDAGEEYDYTVDWG